MKYQNAKSRNPNEKIPPEGRNRKGGLNKRAEMYMGARKSARAIRKDKITETGDKKTPQKTKVEHVKRAQNSGINRARSNTRKIERIKQEKKVKKNVEETFLEGNVGESRWSRVLRSGQRNSCTETQSLRRLNLGSRAGGGQRRSCRKRRQILYVRSDLRAANAANPYYQMVIWLGCSALIYAEGDH